MKFLVKGHVLSDASEEAEIGGSLEMKFMLGSAQFLTGDPMCTESFHEVPIGRGVTIVSARGRVQVAQLP